MKISTWSGFKRGEAPSIEDDVARVFESMSRQISDLTKALQSRLGPENSNQETRELAFQDGIAQDVELQTLAGVPVGVVLLWQATAGGVLHWERGQSESKIRVSVTWPSPGPTTRVRVRFLVIGG